LKKFIIICFEKNNNARGSDLKYRILSKYCLLLFSIRFNDYERLEILLKDDEKIWNDSYGAKAFSIVSG